MQCLPLYDTALLPFETATGLWAFCQSPKQSPNSSLQKASLPLPGRRGGPGHQQPAPLLRRLLQGAGDLCI